MGRVKQRYRDKRDNRDEPDAEIAETAEGVSVARLSRWVLPLCGRCLSGGRPWGPQDFPSLHPCCQGAVESALDTLTLAGTTQHSTFLQPHSRRRRRASLGNTMDGSVLECHVKSGQSALSEGPRRPGCVWGASAASRAWGNILEGLP